MIIENIIRRLKGNPGYKWDSSYTARDLFIITSSRAIQLMRGLWLKLFLKQSTGLLFKGRRVNITHAYQVTASKNLILGNGVSINALSFNGITFGNNVSIGQDAILFCTGIIAQKGTGITIGNGTGINARAYFGGQGGITIGSDVIMGPGVQIFSENHNFNRPGIPIKEQGVTRLPVVIENNCWIGADVKILAGVTIGRGCVVAAGSVVTKTMPACSVIAGVPAKVIKTIA